MKLVIAEKPSVAAEIAKVMGADKRGNGFFKGTEYVVSWCVGHLVETVMPEVYDKKYQKWHIMDLPIIPQEWKYQVSAGVQAQFGVVKMLMESDDIDEIICATDAGREGELIFRLVYNQAECTKSFKRLWISSMETKAIRDGFAKLKEGREYDRLYQAALCRLQADWLVGINFSRLFACMANAQINIGRVQTPTVNLIVERQRAIDQFDSKPFYILTAACSHDGMNFTATKRVESKEESEQIVEKCHGKTAQVAAMTQAPVKENPSALYDLTTLQREANKMLGLSAQQTLDATQNLYEKKLVTYPRTDSRYLTADMKDSAGQIVKSLLKAPYLDKQTSSHYDLNHINIERLINDKKVTDHHAIIPTIEAWRASDKLPKNEFHILLLIVYKLLTSAYLPHEYIKTELFLNIEGEEFKATGRQITENGFKEITAQLSELLKSSPKTEEGSSGKGKGKKPKKKTEEKAEEIIPALTEGQTIQRADVTSKEKSTQPPKPYTEDTLLSAMENAMKTLEDEELKKEVAGAGLGTPATRAGIIERIIKTGFVERKGKNLLPTAKAYEVVDLVPEKVKSAVLTAEWEQKLEQIYKGEIESREFIDGIIDFVDEMVESYTEGCVFDERGREIIGKCPRCGKNIYEGKKNYYCEGGKECGFTIWKEDKFFLSKRKPLTRPMVKAFLEKGRIKAVNLYSEKKDTTYSAYIFMEDTGQYVNFKLYFPKNMNF
ncbi:DNA topoisomerase 3 [Aminipila luticellarii]|uniref:DNA topoisomerase n=1 Tax=Aminipila luticellarii TaxID=2507160 RepID=A0A410PT66_9FIRM|nr:DNA topoisomerase 3 [Aminipila luticellarii]QAT42171.1 DNA topoisomerase 3 [Aminipila luticellarii]